MPYALGITLSAAVAVFARVVGLDRDRAFYPTVMIVIASYYVLFAVMSGSAQTVIVETAVMALFVAAAVAGFKSSAWIVVAALVLGAHLATRRVSATLRPGRWQTLLEVLVSGMRDQIRDVSQHDPGPYLPFVGTLFLFIATRGGGPYSLDALMRGGSRRRY